MGLVLGFSSCGFLCHFLRNVTPAQSSGARWKRCTRRGISHNPPGRSLCWRVAGLSTPHHALQTTLTDTFLFPHTQAPSGHSPYCKFGLPAVFAIPGSSAGACCAGVMILDVSHGARFHPPNHGSRRGTGRTGSVTSARLVRLLTELQRRRSLAGVRGLQRTERDEEPETAPKPRVGG